MAEPRYVAVTGLAFEARIAAGPGVTVVCGGTRLQLIRSLEASLRHGCRGILSFGIAGGLAPHLGAGDCVIARNIIAEHGNYPSNRAWAQSLVAMIRGAAKDGEPSATTLRNVSFGDIAGADEPVACTRAKQSLFEQTGAIAVDMESHVAARFAAEHRIPFAAFRVITDPSHRPLPPAALVATRREGTVDAAAVFRSLILSPRQVPMLIRLALDSWAARQALVPGRRLLGPNLGLPDVREHLLDVA